MTPPPSSTATPLQHYDPDALPIAADLAPTVAYLACASPSFWRRVGHGIDASAVAHPALKLIIETVRQIASETKKPPESVEVVSQHLVRKHFEGKVTASEIHAVSDLIAASADGPMSEDAVVAALAPSVRRRLESQAIRVAIDAHGKRTGLETAEKIFQRAKQIGIAQPSSSSAELGIAEIWDLGLEPPNFLLPAYAIAPGAVTILGGYGGAGKSMLAHDLGVAVASGLPAWGHFPVRQGAVCWIDFDGQGGRLWARRLRRFAAAAGLSESDLQGKVFFCDGGQRLDDAGARDWLTRRSDGRALLVIDSLRSAVPDADENSSGDMRRALDMASEVSERSQCAILVLHHATKKSSTAPTGMYRLRGSGGAYDAASVVIRVDEETREVHVDKDRLRSEQDRAKPRRLIIEDVLVGKDPRGGLRVVLEEASTGGPTSAEDAVLDVLAATPGLGVRAIEAAIGGKKDGSVGLAVARLSLAGRVVDQGTARKPAWHVAAATPTPGGPS